MSTGRESTSNFTISQGLVSFGNAVPFTPDYTRLPLCECGEAFLGYAQEHFSQVLAYPTIRALDQAILSLTIEYAEHRRTMKKHPLNSCVPEVFHEVLDLFTQKRWELLRHQQGKDAAHLSIGRTDHQTSRESS